MFFAPRGVYTPCGMFTASHLLALLVCLAFVGVGAYFSRNIGARRVTLITRITAVSLAFLEGCKIFFNFRNGYTDLDSWFPFAFCSLFIYSLFISGFCSGKLKKVGESYIACAGFVAGLAFLLVPSTSLSMYPLFHFLSFYSLLFHSLMLYLGITYITNGVFVPSLRMYPYYIVFTSICCVLATVMNSVFGCNMMFLREPFNLPRVLMAVLVPICEHIPALYTAMIFAVYILVPFFATLLAYKLIDLLGKRLCRKKQKCEQSLLPVLYTGNGDS